MVKRQERRRAGSTKRDALRRSGGDWTTLRVPENVEIFQPEAKKYELSIVLYKAGDDNPYADSGAWYYERTFWAHRGVGPNNKFRLCLAKTSDKPCPICELMVKMQRDSDCDKDVVKAMRPSERQLWLVFDHAEPDKGVQLWEISYYAFGRLLEDRRTNADEDEEYMREFDDPKSGSRLRVTFAKEPIPGGGSFLKATAIDFKPRRNGLDDSLLDHGICLDDLLVYPDYNELKKEFLMEFEELDDPDDVKPEEKPKKTKSAKRAPLSADGVDLEDGMLVRYEDDVYEITRISSDGTSLTLEPKDGGDKWKGIDPDEVTVVEEDDDDEKLDGAAEFEGDDIPFDDEPEEKPKEKPAKKSVKKKSKLKSAKSKKEETVKKASDDDNWDDWDDDD